MRSMLSWGLLSALVGSVVLVASTGATAKTNTQHFILPTQLFLDLPNPQPSPRVQPGCPLSAVAHQVTQTFGSFDSAEYMIGDWKYQRPATGTLPPFAIKVDYMGCMFSKRADRSAIEVYALTTEPEPVAGKIYDDSVRGQAAATPNNAFTIGSGASLDYAYRRGQTLTVTRDRLVTAVWIKGGGGLNTSIAPTALVPVAMLMSCGKTTC